MKFVVSLVAALAATSAFANAPAATPASKGDPKAAESIVNQVCAACHAVDGNSVAAANPKLAGLNAEYINKQLTEFKSGARKNAIMSGMVANLTPQDMLNLSAYYSAQQPKPATSKDQALALQGQKIFRGGVMGAGVPACASCHGPQGKGIPAQFPRLAGQHSDYIYAQLNAFRVEARANDAAKMMRTIAAKMTDADMKAVASYIQGLR
ncbi:MAG: c-type cytochrome [Thiobacillus sp.]|nr:cytochrome c4 [Gammaproteobacteria bacterium]MDO9008226.1 c-type cytochrome [Thiobacillus sp.]MDP1925930.1 c-type cytochrome [Thiobacillus sp.]MDP3125335.1 c-type cytochrome [Thiobacillus sp.]